MSARPYYSPDSSQSSQGTNLDPNVVRRYHMQAHDRGATSHGGNMDPNAVRRQKARTQPSSSSSSPRASPTQPLQRQLISHGPPNPAEMLPMSPLSANNAYHTPEKPQSTQSVQYFPPQTYEELSQLDQFQKSPGVSISGLQVQVVNN